MEFRFSRTRNPLALFSCAALAASACGDDHPSVAPDTSEDVGADTDGGPGTDVGSDTTPDTEPDTSTDTEQDTTRDTEPDSTPDAEPDAEPDVEPDTAPGPIDIVGDYDDGFGGFVRIAETFVSYTWYGEDIAISAYDNDGGWIVGQNSPNDPWSPNLWSRMEWVETADAVLWCQTEFAAESEEAALAGASADREDAETGCSGFPWTVLTPGHGPIAVAGEYDDGFGGFVRVDNTGVWFAWAGAANVAMTEYDNGGEWAIGQNSTDDPSSPNLWSRFEWALSDDGFYWCQTGFSEADANAARALEAADRSDWEGGCSGFSWSRITLGQGPIAIGGEWANTWGGEYSIDNESWLQAYPESPVVAFEIAGFSNADGAAFAMNSEDNEFFAGDWSRFDWAWVEGALWYCQTVFDGDNEEAVRAAAPAAASDPAGGGCGGAPWTELAAVEAE